MKKYVFFCQNNTIQKPTLFASLNVFKTFIWIEQKIKYLHHKLPMHRQPICWDKAFWYKGKWGKGNTLTVNSCILFPVDKTIHPIHWEVSNYNRQHFPYAEQPTVTIFLINFVIFKFFKILMTRPLCSSHEENGHGHGMTALSIYREPTFTTQDTMVR